jgi:hypothetical protein
MEAYRRGLSTGLTDENLVDTGKTANAPVFIKGEKQ